MIQVLLYSAQKQEVDVITTACPLCQVNLECYQQQVNQEFGTNYSIPVLYFTQLIGLAMGIPPKRLGIGSELVPVTNVLSYVKQD
jgi:heterodisulfide reductase subunit B